MNILFEKIQIGILVNPFARFFGRFENDFALFMIGFLRWCQIIHLGKKPSKNTLSRAVVLWEEAEKRGIEMREVKIFDRSVDTYIVRKKVPGKIFKKVIVFSGLPRPANNINQAALAVLDDKAVFKKTCEKHGLPAPKGGYAYSFAEAKAIFDRIEKPVIVKPRLGSRGRHVVTYVRTHDELEKAFRIARQLCLWVIVEEQIIGPVYRGTVINHTLEGVLAGFQPMVTGDGEKNLTTLIKEKNASRDEGVAEVEITEKMNWFMKRQLNDGRRALTKEDLKNPWKLTGKDDWDQSLFRTYIPKK